MFRRAALARPDARRSKEGVWDLTMRLQNKVALITGGTSGIGEATALLFAREGAKVAITGRNEQRGHAVIEQILEGGGQAIFLRTDVRKAAECRAPSMKP